MRSSKIVILNGSPKPNNSTSAMLSDFLCGRLTENGVSADRIRISDHPASETAKTAFINRIESSGMIFLITPLYVDSLPYNVIEAMELMKRRLPDKKRNAEKSFVVLCQSGMEFKKNRVVLQICECFSKEMNFRFGGALALGFGGVLNGADLASLDRLTKNVQKALTLIADAIAQGSPIPVEAHRLLARPMMPGPMFIKRYLFNHTMKNCLKKGNFSKGIDQLHSRLRLFYS